MRICSKKIAFAISLLASMALPSVADAAVLAPGTGWTSFDYDGEGSLSSRSFEFTSVQTTRFTVADVYLPGERFEVRNFGTVLGLTSNPLSVSENDYIEDPNLALLDPKWSSAAFVLAPGTYSIDLRVLQNPHGSGVAFAKLDTVVAIPEPVSAIALASGFAFMAARRYKQRKRV